MSLAGLVGVGIEVYLRVNNFIWPLGAAFLGSIAGVICDTALYFYRKQSWKEIIIPFPDED